MIEFEIKSRKLTLGNRKGQTVFYATPKSKDHVTTKMLVEQVVRETSLSAGDLSNAIITMGTIICDILKRGHSVDLGDLGSLRIVVPPRMIDKEEDVTAASLKTPKIVFTPKANMREAAKSVELLVDNPKRKEKNKKPKPPKP